MDKRILQRFLEAYPFQPATAIWRSSEVPVVGQVPFPAGLGLDLGCGDGKLTRIVSDLVGGLRLVGLDVDPQETALAQEARFYERIHTSSADRIPEADGAFDYVLSISVMEHIARLEPVLIEVARVLKPGGRLVTSVPSIGFHDCLRGPLLPGRSRQAYLDALDRRLAHVRYWTTAEWQAALTSTGLRLIEVRPFQSRDEVRRWETISRVTAGILHAAARNQAPIEIQRSLGLRRSTQRMPVMLARALALLLGAGVDSPALSSERESGCLLVIAERPEGGRDS
jgi:SAM-dependent methyltransferase